MIWYVPLEHLEGRYTTHLDESIRSHLKSMEADYTIIYPNMNGRESQPPPKGYFLNAPATIEFKALQIATLAQRWSEVRDGDIIFVSDLWMPGIESLFYLKYFSKKDVKIRGLLHAGSFTDTDFVRDMERWASMFENAIFDGFEKVFVGSHFMKNDVCKKRLLDPSKVVVTGFPLDRRLQVIRQRKTRDNIVVFNGRLCDEKQPWLVDQLADKFFGKAQFVKTQEMNLSKAQYYDLLGRAKVIVSFALQENFGFGILEAAYLGCVPVVPNRLVYPEHFAPQYLYDNFSECADLVSDALEGYLEVPNVSLYEKSVEEWFK
jgi:hypothetical protein